MSRAGFGARLAASMAKRGRLCVGIDPHPASLTQWGFPDDVASVRQFALALVEAAEGVAPAVKPQSALFERFGSVGIGVLEEVLGESQRRGLLTLLDVKRGDIGSTMTAYAQAYLRDGAPLAADAITLSPYLGFGSLLPAVELAVETGRGVFVLALTSNPEGSTVQLARDESGRFVAELVLRQAAQVNSQAAGVGETCILGPVGVVIGATLRGLPQAVGAAIGQFNGPILAPGIGAQGATPGDLATLFGAALPNVLAPSSRSLASLGPDPAALRAGIAAAAAALA